MTYSVRLTDDALEDLRAALEDFPVRAARAAVFERLRELGRNPSMGTRVDRGPLEGSMAHVFRVSWPPISQLFTAYYQFGVDEQTLLIVRITKREPTR